MRQRLIPIVAITVLAATAASTTPVVAADAADTRMTDWAASAFGTARPSGPALTVRRHEYAALHAGESILGTPLKIGQTTFPHGLGTHVGSELAVALTGGTKSFRASVGVDNNSDTQGKLGSALFIVEADGKELYRSKVCRAGEEPVAVDVGLPEGARELVLKAEVSPDGPAHGHADWADARVVEAGAADLRLDDLFDRRRGELLPTGAAPFSFVYDGKPSATLLHGWEHKSQEKRTDEGTRRTAEWSDPKTGLTVVATATAFDDSPAVEWVLRFENRGTSDCPILEDVQALDVTLGTDPPTQPVVLDQIRGDDMSERSFQPELREVHPRDQVQFAPNGGRPSTGAFPFYNVQFGDGGLFVALGWTGQWAASVARDAAGPTRLRAGMQLTHLKLHPGESIRTPRVMLLRWTGDRIDAHNSFRRTLLDHYLKKAGPAPGQLPRLAVAVNIYDFWAMGGSRQYPTEAGQLDIIRIEKALGCDTHWFDAGWFVGDFPNGVGNWDPKPDGFPRGLKPVGDFCREQGLGFCLWYEPERVAAGSKIARDHPEFVLGGHKAGEGGLFNFGDEKARQFMTDLLDRQITEFGVTTYRNDFNMEPLGYWRGADEPDRQGITEIRYVEGLYATWDALRAKHPGLEIDDCASGGRRIDLETCARSVVQTDSDTGSSPGHTDSDQGQALGLNLYLPLHSTIGWDPSTYAVRSTAAAGYVAEWDILGKTFAIDQGKADIAEVKENQKYCSGDYYPLTEWTLSPQQWVAWQLHRPDLDSGIVLAFRRPQSPYPVLQVQPRGLKPGQRYKVSYIDDDHKATVRTLTGAELASSELRLEKSHSSFLVRYEPERKAE